MHCKHSSELLGYVATVQCLFYFIENLYLQQKKGKKGTSNKNLILQFNL